MTKLAIAACALRLAAKGVMDLDAPLDEQAYSLRDLLAHRAGVPCYAALPGYHAAVADDRSPWSVAEVLARTGDGVPVTPPGQRWAYSNIGYLLVRLRLQDAAGVGLSTLLRSEILSPVGAKAAFLAEGRCPRPHLPGLAGYDYGWVYHGCLMGPPGDAARMVAGILDGTLLPPDALRALRRLTPLGGALPGRPWQTANYGLGLMAGEASGLGPVEGHSGGGPFSTCAVYRGPSGQVAAAFATTRSEAAPEWAAVRALRHLT
ncbi:beta-lactamase family protein [Jannaschia sp. M317]|nr:beta-lactamase family protein [Jannaschia sp. M317]